MSTDYSRSGVKSTTSSSSSTPSSPTTAGRPMRSPVAPNRPLPPTPGAGETIDTGIQLPMAPLQTPKKSTVAAPSVMSNPFNVDLVIPFCIANSKGAASEIAADYERLISVLENEGGLRVTTRPGRGAKGSEEVWVFVGVTNGKVTELQAREKIVDQAHGMRVEQESAITPATRLRLAYELLTSPPIQHGLGITPEVGDWKRVKAIVALHDDDADAAWLERWTVGGDWKVGLLRGLGDQSGDLLGRNATPEVRLYFNFLATYTLSLLPITIVALVFWLKTPADTYPPAFAFCLSIYATVFIAVWRIHQRKLAVRWGTYGCEDVSVQLRPQYVRSHGIKHLGETTSRWEHIRDVKVLLSVPVILGCGFLLACVLSSIFLLEAFVGHLYHGPGQAVIPYIPMALFSLVVPQVVTLFNTLSGHLVNWEDHASVTGATKSLTAKTFAMNMIVAYSGLYLTSYVYLPFGPYLMAYVDNHLRAHHGGNAKVSAPHNHHDMINVGRLKGQIFAYMVTNQVINTFLEVGLPYILRFVNDFREGKVSFKDLKGGNGNHDAAVDPEKRFLDKVAHELTLPPYNIFTDYAEMVTQFGYVVIWGIVWPLAPLFALVNNYFELRSDAVKLTKHVRRPLGGRVESIGTWLDMMAIIAWMGAWTSTSLIYLFRPSTTVLGKANRTLALTLAHFNVRPSFATVISHLTPVALAALAASHGYFILRALINAAAERTLWRGSPEQVKVQGVNHSTALETRINSAIANEKSLFSHSASETVVPDAFWNGTDVGVAEIRRTGKTE